MFEWNIEKNKKLKIERKVCFEDVLIAITEGKILDNITHSNILKYPNQNIFIIYMNNYIYCVPYIINGDNIFLKTIFPDRRAYKKYKHLIS